MERLSVFLPAHLIHPSFSETITVLAWGLLGAAVTAFGGLTAARSRGHGTRLALGMALTFLGVAVVGSAVLFHNFLNEPLDAIGY